MTQKMVIKVQMHDQKGRSKALKIAVGISGVESAALQGQDKDEVVVTGDGVDAVVLTSALRKCFCSAELVSVGENKKEEKKEKQDKIELPLFWTAYQYPPNYPMVYESHNQDYPSCSIL